MTDPIHDEPQQTIQGVIAEAEQLLKGWDDNTDPGFSEDACAASFCEDGWCRGDAEMFARGAGVIRRLLATLRAQAGGVTAPLDEKNDEDHTRVDGLS